MIVPESKLALVSAVEMARESGRAMIAKGGKSCFLRGEGLPGMTECLSLLCEISYRSSPNEIGMVGSGRDHMAWP